MHYAFKLAGLTNSLKPADEPLAEEEDSIEFLTGPASAPASDLESEDGSALPQVCPSLFDLCGDSDLPC